MSATAPSWLNNGDNAWQLTAATLVGLQSVPGLVVLYAGIVKTKWAINSAFMALYAFAMVLVVWVIFAYEMSFGGTMIPGLVGIPKPVLSIGTELEQVCPTLAGCFHHSTDSRARLLCQPQTSAQRTQSRPWCISSSSSRPSPWSLLPEPSSGA